MKIYAYTLLFIVTTILMSSCNTEDDTVIVAILGCTNPAAYNYNPIAAEDDGSCCLIGGCTDSSDFNYNPNACFDDGSCIAFAYGCTDPTAWNFDSSANTDDGSCEYDYLAQYTGEWAFTKYTSVSHPYDPSSSDVTWIGEITYGNSDNTLFIPHNNIPEGSTYCYCYEFEINTLGEINNETYDANDFNYFFNGYFSGDSLYYTGTEGSPFSTTSITVYGNKLN